jgi:dipeptidyl-peptidase 4
VLRALLLSFILLAGPRLFAAAEATSERIERALAWADSSRDKVYRDALQPHWLSGGERFWYEVATGPKTREYVLVHATDGTIRRTPRLDDLGLPPVPENRTSKMTLARRPPRSTGTGPATSIDFLNTTPAAVRLFWIDHSGDRQPYDTLAAGAGLRRDTFEGHAWLVADAEGRTLATVLADDRRQRVIIDGPAAAPAPGDPQDRAPELSPDGRWRLLWVDNNVVLHHLDAAPSTPDITITVDGTAGSPYLGPPAWSPDSRALVVTRVTRAPVRQITLPAPSDPLASGPRSLDYIKPGDPLPDPPRPRQPHGRRRRSRGKSARHRPRPLPDLFHHRRRDRLPLVRDGRRGLF